jgi:hypothetical protein
VKFRSAIRLALQAARANVLPGLLLQGFLLVFLTLYVAHEGTRSGLARVADWKEQTGYGFAFFSYVLSAAVLPEVLKVVFFQKGRPTRANLAHLAVAAPAWGLMGVVVDLFYRGQAHWFGAGNTWLIIVLKVVIDQFVFSPFLANPVMVGYFAWWNEGFRRNALGRILRVDFYLERVFPVQVAGWIIWIPGVALVYFMPTALQFPVASLIQCFWVLVFAFLNRPAADR